MDIFNVVGKILKKFKAKSQEKKEKKEQDNKEELLAEKEKVVIKGDIAIHTMPERFRFAPTKISQAKMTGVFIIIGGAILLIAIAIVLYFYFFKDSAIFRSASTAPEQTQAESEKVSKAEEQPIKETTKEPVEKEIVTPPPTPEEITEEPLINIIEATTTPIAEVTEISTSTPVESGPISFSPGLDSDGDQLTDKEEKLLNINANKTDSDSDGYNDLTELINLYNPAGTGELINHPNIKKYFNNSFNYSLLYPASWSASTIGGDESVMFTSADNQFIQVIVQFNSNRMLIEQWYESQFNLSQIMESQKVSYNNWQGVKNEDGLTIYLTDLDRKFIFTLAYNPGQSNVLDYINIYKVMIKSLEISE